MNLGTVRVGESLHPVTQIHLFRGEICVHFVCHGPQEHDVWMLFDPDGELVFRTAYQRATLSHSSIHAEDHVEISWALNVNDKLVQHNGRPDAWTLHG